MSSNKRVAISVVAVASLLAAASSFADVTDYDQDFEGLVLADPNALSADGWLIFGNVFDAVGGGFLYGYGPFAAPNGGPGWSAIATGEGGAGQGQQQLVIYNDYNNADHQGGLRLIESNVFQEQVVAAEDVGDTYIFRYDAKKGDITGASTALAYLQTLDPVMFQQSTYVFNDTSLQETWGTYELQIDITAALVGHILQFGFRTTASNFEASGNFYDNLSFAKSQGSVDGDQDGDGKSDILFRNNSTGANQLYIMNGTTISQNLPVSLVSSDWEAVGRGDYNGDLKTDILWRYTPTGAIWIYFMDGDTVSSSAFVATVSDSDWKVAGNGDYNGNGMSDILWHHQTNGTVWLYEMNGNLISNSTGIGVVPDTNWDIVGSGDYDGDGNSDVLWRNAVSGTNWMYLMDGATISTSVGVSTTPDLNWSIVGNGDYDGDGKSDILWRNGVSGTNWMYLMNGTAIATSASISVLPDLNWTIVGDGDYNGDGKSDVLWRNLSTGTNYMYLMNGLAISSGANVSIVTDQNWQIVNTN